MACSALDTHGDSGGWRPARWVVPLFALAALVLVPWIVFLVRMLPSTHTTAHWDIAWAGFDLALALLLLGVAVAAWRRSPWLEGAASAAAALLVVDAWFDILTASSGLELGTAIGEAALIELPLAVLCLMLARDTERLLANLVRRAAVDPRTTETALESAPVRARRPESSPRAAGRDRRPSRNRRSDRRA